MAPAAPPPTRRPRRTATILVIIIVVVLVVAVVGVLAFEASTPMVQITAINFYAPNNACGWNANPLGYYGFNDSPGVSDTVQFPITNYNATSCTLQGALTNTSGFSVNGTFPTTFPGNSNATLTLTIGLPGSSFNGVLNLVFH